MCGAGWDLAGVDTALATEPRTRLNVLFALNVVVIGAVVGVVTGVGGKVIAATSAGHLFAATVFTAGW